MVNRTRLIGSCIALTALLAGCGYFRSGTWENDPRNFTRAWGISKPADVDMVHSWYWRSPHFTREEAYYFHFKWHESLFRGLIDNNQMQPAKDDREAPDYCFPKPDWFAPGSRAQYETWRRAGAETWMFRERSTRDLFIFVCQM